MIHFYTIAAISLAVVLQAGDVVTTLIVLNEGGEEEGIAAMFARMGWPRWAWMGLPKALFVGFSTFVYLRYGEFPLLVVLGLFSAPALYAIVHNVGQMK